ncbi:mitogen-activated protein kinase kinase kinase yoda [Phtheirospermum japonicum]|uniref:Mitogen-activated protein kinase kinase kinase yoda n=1 Tax=Phtheirospermum japonicum TaxID=374723 RepID=A0A830CVH9_9LAMI|nr:mitogen-activated protein kinase kinase kinase yoda [Phtheirospermum japonicum]
MHWWQGAFTSSSKRHSDDDSVIVSGGGKYFGKAGFFSSRRSRNLARSRKLRYEAENDVESWRSRSRSEHSSSSARSSSAAAEKLKPQPLPMPELHVLLRKDPKFASPSVPLPSSSRGAAQNQRGAYEERERERERAESWSADDVDGLKRISRLIGRSTQTNVEQPQIRSNSRKSPQKQPAKARSPYGYRINIPISAPTSPYSSPALSPPGCDMFASHYMTPPSLFHVWSAPEMPYSDCNFGHNLFYQMPLERTASSVDTSPLQSPTVSPCLARRDSNAQATVHPLPRPPGAGGPSSQSGPLSPVASRTDISGEPISQVAAGKHELVPIKSRWRKGKLIGRGTFGSVYVASNRENETAGAGGEIKVLSRLKHPNIVQYFGSEIVRDKFYIYLEYVHPGSINKFIQDHCGAITESIVRNFTRHILCGLAYLHSTKTIHRDIKGANLLVDAYGVVKLADFGMAKHLNGEAANLSLKGSPYWLAPELLQSVMSKDASSDLALAVDIWSLGCTIIEMMDGKPPWSEYEGVLKETPPIPESLSSDGKDFLQCCFRRNPADRPTASKLLDHPFVNYSQQKPKQKQKPDACTQSLRDMRLTLHVRSFFSSQRNQSHSLFSRSTFKGSSVYIPIFLFRELAAIRVGDGDFASLSKMTHWEWDMLSYCKIGAGNIRDEWG